MRHISLLGLLLTASITALSAQSSVENALTNTTTYSVAGTFGKHDFSDAESAFDWAFTTSTGASYQLQGNAPSDTDVFGWKPVNISTPEPAWYMFQLNGDVDGDGSGKFDWVLLSTNMDSKAAYKLAGVTSSGTFEYSSKLNIDYTVNGTSITTGAIGSLPNQSAESGLIVNEIMASNSQTLQDPQYQQYSDWIELYNGTDSSINLAGYGLSTSSKKYSWTFPSGTTIGANGFLLVWADDNNDTTSLHTDFKLKADDDKVVLYDVSGAIVDSVSFKNLYSDVSYARGSDGEFVKTVVPTPEAKNSIVEAELSKKPDVSPKSGVYATAQEVTIIAGDGAEIYYTLDGEDVTVNATRYTGPFTVASYTELKVAALEPDTGKLLSNQVSKTYIFSGAVMINEVLADNNATNSDETGDYGDWIELYNSSSSTIDLGGYGLSDGEKGASWQFASGTTITPYGYVLVWADDKNSSLHTDFKLSANDDKVVLYNSTGTIIDKVEFTDQNPDYSYAKDSEGNFFDTYIVTPSAANIIGEVSRSDKPEFSMPEGVYASSLVVSLSTVNSADIYYTTDGKSASETSERYTQPIAVNQSLEINAVAQETQDGKLLSNNRNYWYVINHGVYINEVLAKNETVNRDRDFNEYGDWIEIYNSTNETINISGYGLSQSKKSYTWQFPQNTTIAPKSLLLVWADEHNASGNELHTDFKLSAADDQVVLFNSAGQIIDFVEFKDQVADQSLTRENLQSVIETTPTPKY